jgi:hypothetical protein
MQGFHSISSPISNKLTLNQQLAGVLEEIRYRQLQKHASGVESDILEMATLACKDALVQKLVSAVEDTNCHLAQLRRKKGIDMLTGN